MSVVTDRQYQIIEAAGKILTESGVNGLTIKKLAEEIGFTEPALYRHFKSKEDILSSMLEYLAKNMDERLTSVIAEQVDVIDQLKGMFSSQVSFFEKHPFFIVAAFSDGLMDDSQQINEVILRIIDLKYNKLTPVLLAGQESGIFRSDIPLEILCHVFIASFRLQMFEWKASGFEFDIQSRCRNLLENLLKMIIQTKNNR